MPSIQTPSGKFRYQQKAIYPGIKPIDKEISKRNLLLLKHVFDTHGLSFMLGYGTLLGAVRDHDFITHDEDIDLVLKEENRGKFLELLPVLKEKGLELVRFDRRGLFSLMKEGEYIDIYFFRRENGELWECGGNLVPDDFMKAPEPIPFMGATFMTHSDYMGFLECEYGEDWHTPVVFNDYRMSKAKRTRFWLKEKIKLFLPDWLYFKLVKRSERYIRKVTGDHIRTYRQLQEKRALK